MAQEKRVRARRRLKISRYRPGQIRERDSGYLIHEGEIGVVESDSIHDGYKVVRFPYPSETGTVVGDVPEKWLEPV